MLCPRLKEGKEFESSYTGLAYKIRHHLTCKSKYVVYLVTCQLCLKQYVGKTTQFMHTRHTGHRSEIENQTSELGEHFHRCGVENLSLQIIDCVRQGEDETLSVLEGYWQNVLATFQANDGNKLGLSCAKLRIVELKIEDNKILGLNEHWCKKLRKIVVSGLAL